MWTNWCCPLQITEALWAEVGACLTQSSIVPFTPCVQLSFLCHSCTMTVTCGDALDLLQDKQTGLLTTKLFWPPAENNTVPIQIWNKQIFTTLQQNYGILSMPPAKKKINKKTHTLNKCKQNCQSNSGLYYSQLLLCSLSSCYFPQTTFCRNFMPTSKQIP